jgi:hypothetical protein
MTRTISICLLVVFTAARPAHAQLAVIDPANLAQAILIAERTSKHYEELRRQFETIRRMAQGLGDMERFRTPPIALTQHDPLRWTFGRAWLEGLNSGDPSGAAFNATALPLESLYGAPAAPLSTEARRAFERRYATVEVTDSAAQTGGHQVGLTRGYHEALQSAVAALESDVLNRRPEYHEMTAILDEIAAAELLARRQDMTGNQLLSYALEQLLARGKSLRDTEAAAINMQISTWRDAPDANRAFVVGTGDALRAWRQP